MIVDNIKVLPIVSTVIVDSQLAVSEMMQHVRKQNFVLCQHYNHTVRSYQPVLCVQAVQVEDIVYVIDCLSAGVQ